jgi:osmotically-inducible protein OsmY
MKRQPFVLAGLALCAGLFFVPAADAQLLTRWFGSRTPDKTAPAKPTQPDSRRISEVNIEIAWLADPVTFPYYLEAHANATQLEVRGYVPNKSVREQAIRIAQVHSSLPVVDAMKEHPSLLVKTSQMSPKQLQSSVQSSLRVALPKQHQQLKTECGADGKVSVVGSVNTYEEKLAVSHALRRLHGCTSVQNQTTLPADVAQKTKTPIIKTSNPTEKPTREEPPLLDPRKPDGPVLLPEPKTPPKVEMPAPKAALTAGELQKRIQAVCPQVKNIEVKITSAKDVTITLEIRTEAELTATFQRVVEMPELQNYRPEIQFKIIAP